MHPKSPGPQPHIPLSLPTITTNVEAQLPRMKPGVHPDDDERDGHTHLPQLDIKHINVEISVDGADDRGEDERVEQVPADAVIPPQRLGLLHPTKHARHTPDQEPEEVLRQQHEARRDAQVPVGRVEVAPGALPGLVGLDDGDAGDEEEEGQQVERGVGAGALGLLARRPRRLQDQDGLRQDEHAGGLEERVRAEERDQRPVAEDGGPYQRGEEDRAGLREPGRSWCWVLAGVVTSLRGLLMSGCWGRGGMKRTAVEVVKYRFVGSLHDVSWST